MRLVAPALALVLAASALPGCSTSGRKLAIVTASPASVTFRFKEGRAAQAQNLANNHCSNFGRRAILKRVTPEGSDRVGIFDCAI